MSLLLFLGSWLALEAILRAKPIEPSGLLPDVKQPEAAAEERPLAGQLLNMSKALEETRGESVSRYTAEETRGERH